MLSLDQQLSTQEQIVDVDRRNFMKEVMDASKTKIVLVDFWAPWCGACKQLMPLLEKSVAQQKGAVKLAKINIDESPEIAQQMHIQSVPAVFAFFKGQPVDGFMGMLPESQLKSWLDRLVKATGGLVNDPQSDAIQASLDAAQNELKSKNYAQAEILFATIMDQDPDNAIAYAGVISSMIGLGKVDQAKKMLALAPPEIVNDKALVSVRAELDLAEQIAQTSASLDPLLERVARHPDDHQSRYDLAMAYYAAGDREQTVDALLDIIKRDRMWNDEAARKQLIKLFDAFGFNDPLTVDARKRLSSVLFS